MKLKVEFIDGSISVLTVLDVHVQIPDNELSLVLDNECRDSKHLSGVSRVTVDNEVIYDYLGRKENYKKEN